MIQNLDRPTIEYINYDRQPLNLNQSALESFEILVMSLNNLEAAVKGLEYRLIKDAQSKRQLAAAPPPPRKSNWIPMAFILGASTTILSIKLAERSNR